MRWADNNLVNIRSNIETKIGLCLSNMFSGPIIRTQNYLWGSWSGILVPKPLQKNYFSAFILFWSLGYVCLFIISCGKVAKILSMRFETPGKFPCFPKPLVMPKVGIPPKFRFPYMKKPSWSITCCKLRPPDDQVRPPDAGVTFLLAFFVKL